MKSFLHVRYSLAAMFLLANFGVFVVKTAPTDLAAVQSMLDADEATICELIEIIVFNQTIPDSVTPAVKYSNGRVTSFSPTCQLTASESGTPGLFNVAVLVTVDPFTFTGSLQVINLPDISSYMGTYRVAPQGTTFMYEVLLDAGTDTSSYVEGSCNAEMGAFGLSFTPEAATSGNAGALEEEVEHHLRWAVKALVCHTLKSYLAD